MKKILLALSLFICLIGSAQPTIKTTTIAGQNAMEYLPSGYNPAQAYNLMLFYPGSGEIGNNASLLTVHGPFQYLKAGVDLKLPLIVIALQNVNANPRPAEIQADITAIKSLFKVNKLILTGLSRGGQDIDWFLSNAASNVSEIGGVIGVSSEGPVSDETGIPGTWTPAWFVTAGVPYWFVCGDQDSFFPAMQARSNSLKALAPALNYFTTFTGAGHGDPVWVTTYTSGGIKNASGQDVYQFAASIGGTVVPPVVVPPVPVTPTCPPAVPCPTCPPLPPPCPVCPKQRSVVSETSSYANGVFTVTYTFDDGSTQTMP
jgi:hypothetical protein